MKKVFLALTTFSLMSFSNAATIQSQFNEEEQNIYEIIHLIRTIHRTSDFSNLKNIYALTNFVKTPNYLHLLELNTENNHQIAVIKYKSKNCDNLKNIKEKLIEKKLITEDESMSCKNNVFIGKLKQIQK